MNNRQEAYRKSFSRMFHAVSSGLEAAKEFSLPYDTKYNTHLLGKIAASEFFISKELQNNLNIQIDSLQRFVRKNGIPQSKLFSVSHIPSNTRDEQSSIFLSHPYRLSTDDRNDISFNEPPDKLRIQFESTDYEIIVTFGYTKRFSLEATQFKSEQEELPYIVNHKKISDMTDDEYHIIQSVFEGFIHFYNSQSDIDTQQNVD